MKNSLSSEQYAVFSELVNAISQGGVGAVLNAPAGSGKTYLTAALVEELLARRVHVAITAPTNKAVTVLIDKSPHGVEAMTTHSLLGLRLKEMEDGSVRLFPEGRSKVGKFQVIIVDECSMLNAELVTRLFQERHNAFLLFVGDENQLKPVGAKSERSPVFDKAQLTRFELRNVVRQKADSGILRLATAIRQHEDGRFSTAQLRDFEAQDVVFADRETLTNNFVDHSSRILAWRNETVLSYNAKLHRREFPDARTLFCVNEDVLFNSQYQDEFDDPVHNGTEGYIVAIKDGEHPYWSDEVSSWRVDVLLYGDGRVISGFYPKSGPKYRALVSEAWRKYTAAKKAEDAKAARHFSSVAWSLQNSFLPLRHAYASTTHKAQGSTFKTTIVDVLDLSQIRSGNEFNKILYTAVTRPSENLILGVH